jgi:hypothetical protein
MFTTFLIGKDVGDAWSSFELFDLNSKLIALGAKADGKTTNNLVMQITQSIITLTIKKFAH